MSPIQRVLRVMVASPSDLSSERARLEEVVRELNDTWSATNGVRLELVRWETHAYPAFGADAQDVINQQLPDDYEIFVGMLWSRFGTPTGRAESGTEEEFNRALARYRADPTSVHIMIYFKNAGPPLNEVGAAQLEQLGKVVAFRERVVDEGGLHWGFESTDHLLQLLRVHLSRVLQEKQRENSSTSVVASTGDTELSFSAEDDELGYLDYLELAEEHGEKVNDSATAIANATTDLNERINKRTDEINALLELSKSGGRVETKAVKRTANRAADDMQEFVTRVRVEMPIFKKAFQDFVSAFGNAISVVEGGLGPEQSLRSQAGELLAILRRSTASVIGFRDSVDGLPRATTSFNRARRATTEVLDTMIGEFESAAGVLAEIAPQTDAARESADVPTASLDER